MRCPECEAAGLASKVRQGSTFGTLMVGEGIFWDEDGRRHDHDQNTYTTEFMCSNGHRWANAHKPRCPAEGCGFNVPATPPPQSTADQSTGER